jgi:hypothetical protein
LGVLGTEAQPFGFCLVVFGPFWIDLVVSKCFAELVNRESIAHGFVARGANWYEVFDGGFPAFTFRDIVTTLERERGDDVFAPPYMAFGFKVFAVAFQPDIVPEGGGDFGLCGHCGRCGDGRVCVILKQLLCRGVTMDNN